MRVLVVEDEPVLQEGLVDLCAGAGHSVEAVGDGISAVAKGSAENFDMVLLDLMLPGLDGIEVCQRLRTVRPGLPIIMLTARGAEEDKVRGLKCGADDYITKPFSVKELLARIEALARRSQATNTEAERIEVDGCVIDLGRCWVQREGQEQTLTAREVGMLRWLHQHKARAVSRAEFLEQVWGVPGTLETRTVDMAVANLRQKIERSAAEPKIVVSVKGVGYAWGS